MLVLFIYSLVDLQKLIRKAVAAGIALWLMQLVNDLEKENG